jgi:hypothetical protein
MFIQVRQSISIERIQISALCALMAISSAFGQSGKSVEGAGAQSPALDVTYSGRSGTVASAAFLTPGASPVIGEGRTPRGPIQDNSFLVEEAYNQEDGIIQHISSFERLAASKDWVYTFTDEWPLRTLKHQFSMTFAAAHAGQFGGIGIGDTAVNYRYQLIGSGETKVAIAPRLSLLLPSGNSAAGRGFGGTGLQTNLPISIVHSGRLVTHWNAGATWIPHAKNNLGDQARTVAVNLGQSCIWQFSNRFNGMLETIWNSGEQVVSQNRTERVQQLFVSPGVRWAYNLRSGLQVVLGVAVPMGIGPSGGEKGVIFYLSFEHPFGWSHSH